MTSVLGSVPTSGGPLEVEFVVDQPPTLTASSPRVVLMHGFARGPKALEECAQRLVEANCVVVRPHVRSFVRRRGMTDPAFIADVAFAAAALLPGHTPIVVVGHSAGGAAAAHAAATLAESGVDVAGIVLVDPNESLTPMLADGVESLAGDGADRIRVIAAEPGRCNRQGLGPRLIAEAAPGFVGVRVAGGRHCEIEGQAADIVCRRVCGGASDPARTDLLLSTLVDWIHALAGTPGTQRIDTAPRTDVTALVRAGRISVLDGAVLPPSS